MQTRSRGSSFLRGSEELGLSDTAASISSQTVALEGCKDPASAGTLPRQHDPAAFDLIDPNPHPHSAMRTVD
jgi:hypothetical protein